MRSGFAWAALIALGFALLSGLIHYGYHLYAWAVSEPTNATFDTVMTVVAVICVVAAFLLLGAGLLIAEPKVQKFISNTPVLNKVVPSRLYQSRAMPAVMPMTPDSVFDYAEY